MKSVIISILLFSAASLSASAQAIFSDQRPSEKTVVKQLPQVVDTVDVILPSGIEIAVMVTDQYEVIYHVDREREGVIFTAAPVFFSEGKKIKPIAYKLRQHPILMIEQPKFYFSPD